MDSVTDHSGILVGAHSSDQMGNVTDPEMIDCHRRIFNLIVWFTYNGDVPEEHCMRKIPDSATRVKDAQGDVWVRIGPEHVRPRRWTLVEHIHRTDLPCPTTEQLNDFGPFEILAWG